MLKRTLISLVLAFALLVSFCGVSYGADILPIYTLKLTVEQSPLDIYPPVMIYTAQLSPLTTSSTELIKVDFYNAKEDGTVFELLGSAPIDPKTGKAVLQKQMPAGAYVAVSKTVVNNQGVTSNTVQYKVY